MLENIVGGSDTPNSLSSIHGITIVAPKGSTNIINVSGSYIKFGNYSILRNTNVPNPFPTADNRSCNMLNSGYTPTATEKEKLLWNFYVKNPTIVMSNISLSGSILAPNGNLKAVGGNIEGNVVVNSFKPYQNNLKYHTELHNFQFSGCIPKLDCISTSTSSYKSISKSISESISESVSISISKSLSGSISLLSESTSASISESTTESISDSITSFCCCSCIDGTVWCDCNCNCRYDCNEKPIECVMVLLYNPKNGCVFKKTYTNKYGYYYFSNVCPENYNIMFYINKSCYFCSDNIIIYQNQCSETVNMGLYKSY